MATGFATNKSRFTSQLQKLERVDCRTRMVEQLRRAQSFADGPAGAAWKVHVSRTPVRGITTRGVQFQQFYDDAILLLDESRGKVAILFSAQFKAGDAASLAVLAQLDSDELRKRAGLLLVDGKQYEIQFGVVEHESAIITTRLGAGEVQRFGKRPTSLTSQTDDPAVFAEALGTRAIQFLPLPLDPTDLRVFVEFFLRATGRIPAD